MATSVISVIGISLISTPLRNTLCGTRVVRREHGVEVMWCSVIWCGCHSFRYEAGTHVCCLAIVVVFTQMKQEHKRREHRN